MSAAPLRLLRIGDSRRLRLVLVMLLLAVTFAQPVIRLQRPRFEMIVVLDVTQSMDVQDQELAGRPVSRLTFARHALRRAIEQLPCGSKLGWAIFTEYRSFLLFAPVEVCANRAELRATLEGIDNRMAWTGSSEIAKGLHSAIGIAKALPGVPSLVFVTDGHEAPPLSPRHRPAFDDKPGEVGGLIVGVGGTTPVPIPKSDSAGRPLGFWSADEVLQVDPRSQGRDASVRGETMTEDGDAVPSVGLGATPGAEHLSSLREPYLQLLAAENGLVFHRLLQPQALAEALQASALARPVLTRVDARVPLAALALALLLSLWLPRRKAVGADRGRRRAAVARP
ncbi:MAG TPA: VWA domain-containing protein [Burkholderiaceae bacterium]